MNPKRFLLIAAIVVGALVASIHPPIALVAQAVPSPSPQVNSGNGGTAQDVAGGAVQQFGPLVRGAAYCDVDVSGTWTGTLNVAGFVTPLGSTTPLKDVVGSLSTISANGVYEYAMNGLPYFTISLPTTGTAQIVYWCAAGVSF